MRTWFITGAARGLGPSLAKRALELGDSVVLATMQDPTHLGPALGAHERFLVVPLDFSHEAHTRAAVAAALRRFGRIDVLVNNVGYDLLGAIEEASAAEVERVFRCNLFGLLNVTRAVLPHLREQGSGHIVNMSSAGSHGTGAGWGIYCAIKSAVEAISEALSMESEPLGIHTTVVESGYSRRNSLSSRPVVSAVQRIDDYRATVGTMRTFAAGPDHLQPGDPDTLANAIVSLVDAPDPPRRLPLVTGTFRTIEKQKPARHEHEYWQTLVLPIDVAN